MHDVFVKKKVLFLMALAALCFLFTVLRWFVTERTAYFFLNWNLLLALIPWVISYLVVSCPRIQKSKMAGAVFFLIWLLFLPNAPYLVTDLVYLKKHPEPMFWYDLLMIFLFAWTGLLSGFFSIDNIKDAVFPKPARGIRAGFSIGLLFVAAFGVYLGRDLRWNSWEVILKPKEIFLDVVDRFIKPFAHGRTWGFTFLMGFFLNVLYWSLKVIQKEK